MAFDESFFNIPRVYVRKFKRRIFGFITLRPKSSPRGYVLLSYVTHPFAITKDELNRSPHTNPWECMIVAETLLERGFAVDVIDWTNKKFQPRKKYAMVIDVNENLERFAEALLKECVKIFFITGAHWKYQNEAEQKRLGEVERKRGVKLTARRQMHPSKNIEYADYATSLGNSFARDTYAYAGKPITPIPLFANEKYQSPEGKDFAKARNKFVWIGGGGAIHKGLDVTLEYFATHPKYELTVCGPVLSEEDFKKTFQNELSKGNVRVVGRIDVRGEKFKKIVSESAFLIYPSCSEGQSGSVTTALCAGLIPIITRSSGVDPEPFGILLKDISVQEIAAAVEKTNKMSVEELEERAVSAWDYAVKNYTKEIFKKNYGDFIDKIIKERNL